MTLIGPNTRDRRGMYQTIKWTAFFIICGIIVVYTLVGIMNAVSPPHAKIPAVTVSVEPLAPPPPRLVSVAYTQVASSGMDWVSVWIIRDQETGIEFLVTRSADGVHSLQIHR